MHAFVLCYALLCDGVQGLAFDCALAHSGHGNEFVRIRNSSDFCSKSIFLHMPVGLNATRTNKKGPFGPLFTTGVESSDIGAVELEPTTTTTRKSCSVAEIPARKRVSSTSTKAQH